MQRSASFIPGDPTAAGKVTGIRPSFLKEWKTWRYCIPSLFGSSWHSTLKMLSIHYWKKRSISLCFVERASWRSRDRLWLWAWVGKFPRFGRVYHLGRSPIFMRAVSRGSQSWIGSVVFGNWDFRSEWNRDSRERFTNFYSRMVILVHQLRWDDESGIRIWIRRWHLYFFGFGKRG